MGFHVTNDRTATKHPHALRAGANVSATLVETTGPNKTVTGARSTPTRSPDVLESRFAPLGTFTAPVKKRPCRWAMAHAGHSVNHTCCAGSPQPQVRLEAGWPDHTCHHRTTAGTANPTMAVRWNATPRSARAIGRRGDRPLRLPPFGDGRLLGVGRPLSFVGAGRPRAAGGAGGSSVGCVDTSVRLVTAGERTASTVTPDATAGIAAPLALQRRSYDSSGARHSPLCRRGRGRIGAVGRPGLGATRVVCRGARGGRRRRPRRRRVQG